MKYLILGNGAAGVEAALAIREHDADGEISIITESKYLHYNRPKLIHYLAKNEETAIEKLIVYDEKFYEEKRINNILSRKIISIDTDKKIVFDNHGGIYNFDKLLLATGSKPIVPPIPGVKRPGVFTLRSATDAQKILRYTSLSNKIIVVGGGLLGLENAWSLRQLGKEVHVIEGAPYLLPRQLDQKGGMHLQKQLEEKGIQFSLGGQLKSINGRAELGSVTEIELTDGQKFSTEIVLLSIGVRGEIGFVRDSGFEVDRGVKVNDFLETSIPNIWAAGDLAEHKNTLYGLWTVAKEQGRVAGLNMAGVPTAYAGSVPATLLKITGISVYSMGNMAGDGEIDECEHTDNQAYRKLGYKEGKLQSAMVIGDMKAIQEAQKQLRA